MTCQESNDVYACMYAWIPGESGLTRHESGFCIACRCSVRTRTVPCRFEALRGELLRMHFGICNPALFQARLGALFSRKTSWQNVTKCHKSKSLSPGDQHRDKSDDRKVCRNYLRGSTVPQCAAFWAKDGKKM
jgi:hypothetical protein